MYFGIPTYEPEENVCRQILHSESVMFVQNEGANQPVNICRSTLNGISSEPKKLESFCFNNKPYREKFPCPTNAELLSVTLGRYLAPFTQILSVVCLLLTKHLLQNWEKKKIEILKF